MPKFSCSRVRAEVLLLATAVFLAATANLGFFRKTLEAYPLSATHLGALVSVAVVLSVALYVFLAFFAVGRATKPVLIAALLGASLISYATNSYGIVADEFMIMNFLKTDRGEVRDLLNVRLFLYLLLLGVLPSLLVWKIRVARVPGRLALATRAKSIGAALVVAVLAVASCGKFYASFFREHKELRSYVNPIYFVYSAGKVAKASFAGREEGLTPFGRDSRVPASDTERDLVILVVGETARADHFSLNGYGKETNPLLAKEGVISLTDLWSCGTSTAVSVPCMFSALGRADYTDQKGQHTENLLDVLVNTKRVGVLWRDNNSDSKGVAVRAPYEDFKTAATNPVCDEECRDEGMLAGLQEYIDRQQTDDIFIVLHQMGNHGPAYYKRYPAAFEKFKPACHTNELDSCTAEEISNAYDNAILYTDYFLSRVIALLKQNSTRFETALFYVSDHGESLGEHGVYLHGLPYMLAPEAQKRPAGLVWLGGGMKEDIDEARLRARVKTTLSHDNVFHSVLGLFEVESAVYRKELDIFH